MSCELTHYIAVQCVLCFCRSQVCCGYCLLFSLVIIVVVVVVRVGSGRDYHYSFLSRLKGSTKELFLSAVADVHCVVLALSFLSRGPFIITISFATATSPITPRLTASKSDLS